MRNELKDNTSVSSLSDAQSGAQSATSSSPAPTQSPSPPVEKPLIVEHVLIEEVSIDGMCGVY